VRGREPIALAPRLSVQPVLGYDAAFDYRQLRADHALQASPAPELT
jgi:hypothetical protein